MDGRYKYLIILIQLMESGMISAMPLKVPIGCLAILTISLALVNLVGLVKVQMDCPPPRLLMITALYLCLMLAIMFIHKKIIVKQKVSVTCTPKISVSEYQLAKKKQTERQLKALKESQQYKQWDKNRNDRKDSTVIYELSSESEDESGNVTCHQLATIKKMF